MNRYLKEWCRWIVEDDFSYENQIEREDAYKYLRLTINGEDLPEFKDEYFGEEDESV